MRVAPGAKSAIFLGLTRRTVLRNIVLPFTALASVFLFPAEWLVIAFLILGQAHFAMAMLYQYRGGRVDRRYLLTLGFLVVVAVIYFMNGGGFYPIFFVAVLMFGAHFSYDEFHLQRDEIKVPQAITLALFVVLFVLMNAYVLVPALAGVAIAAALVFPSYMGARLIGKHWPNRTEAYIWFVGLILMFLTFVLAVEPVILLAVVSILHILNWYIDYGKRLADKGDDARLRTYWLEVIGVILIITVLYVAYRVFNIEILQYLFIVMYYYVWAIIHFTVSFKRQGRKTA